ncbi:hypothetical protein [Streptomyces sp. NPDC051576]|uniref:hypothetical protein n=1 Tax=Streptomyces sp. NPDC051576 TaxID=3155803 RepID=UPI00344815FC
MKTLRRLLRVSATPALRLPAVRAGFAVLPLVTLGLLCPVPSLVLALRRRTRADWLVFAGFSAVLVAWITELALTPDDTHGVLFGTDLLLIALSMAGASAHAWAAWPRPAGRREWRWIGARSGGGGLAVERATERTGGLVTDEAGDPVVERVEE